MERGSHALIAGILGVGFAAPGLAATVDTPTSTEAPAAPFAAVDAAIASGSTDEAIKLLKALARDDNIDVRCEARYRHAELLLARKKFIPAAVLLRRALTEKPHWQRARIELARAFAHMGREFNARREIRAARADGMTPEVEAASNNLYKDLLAVRRIGGTIEVAFAPSSNINRPSIATIINNTISPYTLTGDGPSDRSGNGVRLSSQIYSNTPIASNTLLNASLTMHNQIFRDIDFNDNILLAQVGTITQLPHERWKLTAGQIFRVYGKRLTSMTTTASVNYLTEIGRRGQIEFEANLGNVTYETNRLRNGQLYTGSVIFERSFTARSGGRFAVAAQRQTAKDPGFATVILSGNATVWQDIGRTTIAASFATQHLESDAAAPGVTRRRNDWLIRPGIGITLRQIKILRFVPVLRVAYEWNFSNVTGFTSRRLDGEFALNWAF